jgi:ABC-type uncharacterized transport system substrate-binding protein
MFLDSSVTVRADESGVAGVVLEWLFDEWFSATILLDYDLDRSRKFDPAETQEVYDHAFSNLGNFDYFTYISVGGSTTPAAEVREFAVSVREHRVAYSFFVPFPVPYRNGTAEFAVAVYDRTFFCDVAYAEVDGVSLEAPSGTSISYSIKKDETVSITYDNAVIGASRDDTAYSGIAHPDQIHIVVRR